MISTLLITIIVEGLIALGYCIWRHKPAMSILLTSIGANILTQFLLWGVLILFFQHYLVTLLVTEVLIWIIEGLVLHYIPANQLWLPEGMILSLIMNLVSFALGLILSV